MNSTRFRAARFVAPAAIAVVVLFASPAAAEVYCVDVSGGDCTVASADPQAALDSADTNPGADRVRLGPMTYAAPSSSGFTYSDPTDPVEVIGSGAGQTTLTVAASAGGGPVVINTGVPGSSLMDLTVQIPVPIGMEQYQGIFTGNQSYDVARVRVEAPAPFNGFGMLLPGGGTVDESTIALPNAGMSPGDIGLQSYGALTLTDTDISADTGVSYSPGAATLTMRRSSVNAFDNGITFQSGGAIDVASSVIDAEGTGVSVGNPNGTNSAESLTATLDGVTIVRHGAIPSTGIQVFTNSATDPAMTPADNHLVTVSSSILDPGLDVAIRRVADDGGSANVTTKFSNLDANTNVETNNPDGDGTDTGMGSITPLGGDVNVVSGFVSPGTDFHLLASSPLIDIGDPAAPPMGALDIDRDPRAVLAIPGCAPRRDIGADEFVPASPVAPLDCTPPPNSMPTSTPTSTPTTAKQKCKKKKKRKRKKSKGAVAAKKKSKKCRKKKRKK